MNINEIIDVDITSCGMNGEGIARVDGKVVFVPYVLAGERVKVRIREVKSKYANATVIKVFDSSPDRIAPSCPHYYKCGGCDMGHVSAEYRKNAIIAELKNNFKKIADLDVEPSEFISSGERNGCRNKLSMPFGLVGGKVVLGLYKQNTHVVEPVICPIGGTLALSIAKTVCEFANAKKLSVYNETTQKGLLRHLVVREVGGRAAATLVINAQGFAHEKALGERLPDNVDFFVCPNFKHNNVILGDSVRLIKGSPFLPLEVLGVKAELSPLSFLQVNDLVRDELYKNAISFVSSPVLIDLYSGIGITSNLAAKKAERVIAVECVPQAVENANRTAVLNGNADKIKNICGDVQKVLGDISSEVKDCDILVDPPRKGCGEEVMRAVAKVKPDRLIYISCNHATMCRDIKIFLDETQGYRIEECKLFDMFPDTHHVETLVCLIRR
ncbi:MAG: 23S rRNA (uracil(1939)-C(5))-methyltransferase RlmD [Clostridiales bacterium]|nr:23S rRNA (uracil(1939)-C(5))-methyltransferase RlmD [Clostridiales bacterium]